jgi:hypothetical protein
VAALIRQLIAASQGNNMKFPSVGVRRQFSLVLMAAIAVAGGCNHAAPLHKGQKTVTAAHVAGAPLHVETGNGSITIIKSDRPDVEIVGDISATSEERLAAAKIVATRGDHNTLDVRCEWPDGGPTAGEGCSFQIQIPDAVGVTLVTENGNVQSSDLAGPAKLQTSNGNVTASRQAGPIDAETGNGTVSVSDAAGAVKAATSNGSISIALAPTSAGPIEASGANAMIDLAVGPSFAGTLSLAVTNGIVKVDPSIKAKVLNGDPHDTQLEFGPGGEKSSATTVNGAVRVRAITNGDGAR